MRQNLPGLLITVLAAYALISSCAKVSSPSGGPKDREPPVVIKSNPPDGSVNFRGSKIEITFNEYVVLERINEKFMVSPPMAERPRIYIRRKNVNIEYSDVLRDTTTYTFYFQDAIRDLNEGNAINNFQFVFSTGPVIDSLSVTGQVYNALNLEVPENTLVLLYKQPEDSAVIKQLPDYITRAEPDGTFRIDNVRGGVYRLYAVKDLDNSKNYNLPDEEFAFHETPVEVTPEKNHLPKVKAPAPVSQGNEKSSLQAPTEGEYSLILFGQERKRRFLTSSARRSPYQMIFTLSLPPDSMKFEFSIPEAPDDSFIIETTRYRDTVTVWLTDSSFYNRQQIPAVINYPFTDSAGIDTYRTDTLTMRYLQPRAPRTAPKRTPLRVVPGISSGQLKPGSPVILRSETPLAEPDTSKMTLFELKDGGREKIAFDLSGDSLNLGRYILRADFRHGANYLFVARAMAFTDIYGDYSDSTGTRFQVRTPDSYGMLSLNVINHEGCRIIQLLDRDEKLVREVAMEKDGRVDFPLLERGFYRARAIFDLNCDGRWTTGDFAAGRQPEPVSYYPGEIEVKVNWSLEQDWDLERKNFKDHQLRKRSGTQR